VFQLTKALGSCFAQNSSRSQQQLSWGSKWKAGIPHLIAKAVDTDASWWVPCSC